MRLGFEFSLSIYTIHLYIQLSAWPHARLGMSSSGVFERVSHCFQNDMQVLTFNAVFLANCGGSVCGHLPVAQ
jgi:hypothetical protein